MTRAIKTLLMILAVVLTGCSRNNYDKSAYDELKQVIDGSTSKLIGLSLPDATRELSLEGVPWDEGFSTAPMRQLRIYHFKGFYLMLNLRMIPQGMTPTGGKSAKPATKAASESDSVWFVSDFYPALYIDGIKDPKVRMQSYWQGVHTGMRVSLDAAKPSVPNTNKLH